eukprot:CAMPEP_0119133766 /NCGR_PEP_ID=MMETSP1310-20130426/13544_1 /TAXON_ID=464262 /ORGANISM="Genus nov. species nov., Strain RCC2339" /LENGTH=272 /DNA_ID=CAMNT_0007124467 /DNA_START=156 /DNA_END=971 /DNA_ORIENTATION=+
MNSLQNAAIFARRLGNCDLVIVKGGGKFCDQLDCSRFGLYSGVRILTEQPPNAQVVHLEVCSDCDTLERLTAFFSTSHADAVEGTGNRAWFSLGQGKTVLEQQWFWDHWQPTAKYSLKAMEKLASLGLTTYMYVASHVRSISCHRAFKGEENFPGAHLAMWRACERNASTTREMTNFFNVSHLPLLACSDNKAESKARVRELEDKLGATPCATGGYGKLAPYVVDIVLLSEARLFLGTKVSTFSLLVQNIRDARARREGVSALRKYPSVTTW